MSDQSTDSAEPLAIFWDAILSREPKRILAAARPLDLATRNAVITHLKRMTTEPDWHPEQVKSARAALSVLTKIS